MSDDVRAILETYEFVDVFLDELASVGLDCEVLRREPFRLCGIERFGVTDGAWHKK